MGAAIGVLAGRHGRLGPEDARLLHTALGGAGLAAAFSAPLSGLLFVCEEVTRSLRPRLVLLTLLGTVAAVACAELIVGGARVFPLPDLPAPPLWTLPAFLLFGAAAGALGAAYAHLVVGTLELCDRMTRVPVPVRAAAIGAVVGALMAVDPLLAGGGDPLTERLLTAAGPGVTALTAYLAVRFVAGPLSYAAATPADSSPRSSPSAPCGERWSTRSPRPCCPRTRRGRPRSPWWAWPPCSPESSAHRSPASSWPRR